MRIKIAMPFLAILILWLAGCKPNQPLLTKDQGKLPTTFGDVTDTNSVARTAWREFFTDPVLIALIDTAIARNPDIQIAAQKMFMASAMYRMATRNLLPTLDARVAMDANKFARYTMNGIGNWDTNFSPNLQDNEKLPEPILPEMFIGLMSSWEIDLSGKLRNMKKAAANRMAATYFERQLVQTWLVNAVAKAYYELLALDAELEVLQDNIELQQKALELVLIQKEGGRANQLAVSQFQAQLMNSEGLQILKRQQLLETENYLNKLLGRYPQTIVRGAALMEQTMPQKLAVGLPGTMLQRRPDILMAEQHLFAGYADVKAAKAAFYPSFTINAYGAFSAYKANLMFSSPQSLAFGALLNLVTPLANRNQIKTAYNMSIAASNVNFQQWQLTMYNAVEEVSTQMGRMENYAAAVAKKREEVVALKEGVGIAKDLFASGHAAYLEIIAAQKNVLVSDIELIELRKARFFALIDLYKALGGGWD
jgi:outer membrane protein, multidrug efflux system